MRGEAGTGYVLDDGYDMPPLMLTPDELEAAVLGAAWVAKRGDPALARGARDLITKIAESIPFELRPALLDVTRRSISMKSIAVETLDVGIVRRAVRDRFKIAIAYSDETDGVTRHTIWPSSSRLWRKSALSSLGANCGSASAIFAPTASHRLMSRQSEFRNDGKS